MNETTDFLVFGPLFIVKAILLFKGSKWDYQTETHYQRYYERAELNR